MKDVIRGQSPLDFNLLGQPANLFCDALCCCTSHNQCCEREKEYKPSSPSGSLLYLLHYQQPDLLTILYKTSQVYNSSQLSSLFKTPTNINHATPFPSSCNGCCVGCILCPIYSCTSSPRQFPNLPCTYERSGKICYMSCMLSVLLTCDIGNLI